MPRSLEELIESKEPAWPMVSTWIKKANKPVEILESTPRRGADVLVALQVTTRSPMGAIALQTGGLLIDHGWVRVLGAGCARMEGDLARWNGLTAQPLVQPIDGAMFVATDALGGFFALDGGALGEGKGAAFYLPPDTLEWARVADSYSALLQFFLQADLNRLYGEHRWKGWQDEVKALSPDKAWAFDPPLFAEAEPGKTRAREAVPLPELLKLNLQIADKLFAETQAKG
jgi:Protein of unknown function DUF2625